MHFEATFSSALAERDELVGKMAVPSGVWSIVIVLPSATASRGWAKVDGLLIAASRMTEA